MLSLILVAVTVCSVTVNADGMMGGWKVQDASDPEYMTKATKSMKIVNDDASNNGPYHWMPIKVLSAKSQVVAGAKYELEVLIGESSCKKGEVSAHEFASTNCQLKENPNRAVYKVTVWEKPWENFEQFDVEKIRAVEAHEQF